MSKDWTERIAILLSFIGMALTVGSHLVSLERRLTLMETRSIDPTTIEARLTRIETLLEQANDRQP